MGSTLNLSLTDELRAFVNMSSGDGTLYATPSEFVRDLLRQQKSRHEAALARDKILNGYQDAILVLAVLHCSLVIPARLVEREPALAAEAKLHHEKLIQNWPKPNKR